MSESPWAWNYPVQDDSVWVVSSGEYSDYRVWCALATKDDAEALAARCNAAGDKWTTYRVESLPTVSPDIQQVEVLYLSCTVTDDGTVINQEQHSEVTWPFETGEPPMRWNWHRTMLGCYLSVIGTDTERVRKVYSERKAWLMSDEALRASIH